MHTKQQPLRLRCHGMLHENTELSAKLCNNVELDNYYSQSNRYAKKSDKSFPTLANETIANDWTCDITILRNVPKLRLGRYLYMCSIISSSHCGWYLFMYGLTICRYAPPSARLRIFFWGGEIYLFRVTRSSVINSCFSTRPWLNNTTIIPR